LTAVNDEEPDGLAPHRYSLTPKSS
jgi:hypothetical protein